MPDYRAVEQQLTGALSLTRRPVAVAFRSSAPPGVSKFGGIEPSGCSFWRLAAAERTFYTVPADHHNCPIGSYTHNIPLPAERASELPQTLSLMTELGYLKMEEVPGIPRLPESPGVVIYAPLGDSPVEPDVVLVAGRIDRRVTERRVDHDTGRLGQAWNTGDFLHLEVAELRHERERLRKLGGALGRQRNVVCVAADRAVVMIGRHRVER